MKSIAERNKPVLNLLDYLLRPDVHVVFDIDGTLGVYMFGDIRHSACEDSLWEKFVTENKPYTNDVAAVPQLQKFIVQKTKENADSVHVCSVSQSFEREDKYNFVIQQYPTIKYDNIHFVDTKADKVKLLQELVKVTKDEKKVALVDDTVKTLDMIYEQSEFITVHNSVFMLYN